MVSVIVSLALFFAAALFELGGGYLVWLWLRKKKGLFIGLLGGVVLFLYGVIPTLQEATFGRVYAAYGGIFVVSSILWGAFIDRRKPDRHEIIGAGITLIGALIIFYAPR